MNQVYCEECMCFIELDADGEIVSSCPYTSCPIEDPNFYMDEYKELDFNEER